MAAIGTERGWIAGRERRARVENNNRSSVYLVAFTTSDREDIFRRQRRLFTIFVEGTAPRTKAPVIIGAFRQKPLPNGHYESKPFRFAIRFP